MSNESMVQEQIVERGITDEAVLHAVRCVDRKDFVPERFREQAYADSPLPISHGQTISQPFIVAYMTEQLAIQKTDRVLEIGTGCGYQTAILARLAKEVFTVELLSDLSEQARRRLQRLGFSNVTFRVGNGYVGWLEHAPFDKIIVTASAKMLPMSLVEQLRIGGRLLIPLGEGIQSLQLFTKKKDFVDQKTLIPVRFVPLRKTI